MNPQIQVIIILALIATGVAAIFFLIVIAMLNEAREGVENVLIHEAK